MIVLWLRGAVAGRPGRLLGSVAGMALTVGLLASLGSFIGWSSRTMTHRALANVVVDWQVLVAPGADAAEVLGAVDHAVAPALVRSADYAQVSGLTAQTGGTTQTTGAAVVVGLDADYGSAFPNQLQTALGADAGVRIASQTAANLHVTVGDLVTVQRPGLPPVALRVDGVVNLPNADAMFQAIGVPAGTAPQAPPDNVLILPTPAWHALFDPQAALRPDSVQRQLHVRLHRAGLPPDPQAAYVQALGQARNVEARVAGRAAIANNLAARLDGVRADALYARVLLLFLGAPGAVLAMLLTLGIAGSGGERRRREQALLRLRGASRQRLVRLAVWESLALGAAGVALGLAVAALTVRLAWGVTDLGTAWPGFAAAAALGFALAAAAFVLPAWRDASAVTVTAARAEAGARPGALWQRLGLDLVLLAAGGAIFWRYAGSGYSLVLATEGVAQTAVHYEAFLAPLCLWLGAGLLWIRLARGALWLGAGRLAAWRFDARGLGPPIAASMSRQRPRVARATALVALAFAFATATAVFNTTYDAQARVDALLTNGADVAVTGTVAAPAGALLAPLRALPGVAAAEPLMHRMAYVGADLQDLFGIDAARIGRVAPLADAYFGNHDAAATMAALRRVPDGILVAQETVQDYQLHLGDELNLRLQSAADHPFKRVRFHFVGVVKEFPTAPRDSFLVANAAYLAQATGSASAEVVLLRSAGPVPALAQAARTVARSVPALTVTSIGQTQAVISSSLTAVDLHRLTALELGYSVLLVAVIAGIVLGLDLAERRADFAVLAALGARPAQVGAFLRAEGLFVVLGGMILGCPTGLALAQVLVSLLAGAFDPPPEVLVIPWAYLGATILTALACAGAALALMQRLAARPDLQALRTR